MSTINYHHLSTALLQAARKLLAEKGVTGGACARGADGKKADLHDDTEATCYCSWGALLRAGRDLNIADGDGPFEAAEKRLIQAWKLQRPDSVGYIGNNDEAVDRGQPQKVLRAFDVAIELRAA